ncbi:MAG: universal stress protein [Deltaproteobacteria bacterium]|nr:universal stress protein [Deltaproteobacteria bacterium]
MKSVLLIFSATRVSEKALGLAVSAAKKDNARLVVLYVIEPEIAEEIFDKFSDIGFIGDKPSEELAEAVMKEYRQRAYEVTGKAQVMAMEEGVGFDALIEQGDFVEKSIETIERYKAGHVIVPKRKLSTLAKYFSRSRVDELVSRLSCKVEVVED